VSAELDNKQSAKECDDAAHALAVVSVKKEQNLRVDLSEPGEKTPAGEASVQREGAYAFKAGSSLPEDRVGVVNASQVFLVQHRHELYAINGADLRLAFPSLAIQYGSQAGTIDLRKKLAVKAAFTCGAVPELIRSVGSANIVKYDGSFYVVPQRLGAVRWGEEDVAALPGVIVVSNARDAYAVAKGETPVTAAPPRATRAPIHSPTERSKGRSVPLLRKTVRNYNIVEYEGWYYGLPHSLGPIDLQKVDVIEIPGVIRDVSPDVVEKEIEELTR